MFQKQKTYRSDKWLAAVRSIDCCVLCGKFGTMAAHRNEGKGTGIKADDCLSAALCQECHHEIDNGPHMTREQRRAEIDRAICITIQQLARKGLIGPTGAKWG